MSKKHRPHDVPEADDAPEPSTIEGQAQAAEPRSAAAISPEELARLRERAAEAGSLEDRLKRAQAEFLNETRRIARQNEQDRKFAIDPVVHDLVPVAEALVNAMAAAEDTPECRRLKDGLELVAKQLHEILARHGVEPIDAAGRPFDPAFHEAVFVLDRPDLPPNTVAQVLRPGFVLHGRVVRPAQVAVTPARGAAASREANGPGPDAEDA